MGASIHIHAVYKLTDMEQSMISRFNACTSVQAEYDIAAITSMFGEIDNLPSQWSKLGEPIDMVDGMVAIPAKHDGDVEYDDGAYINLLEQSGYKTPVAIKVFMTA